ncbi:NERD domain-containing protein [Phycicoccus sp. BSK3Z-2]|uniref:NERD domain-containing protein n=1 Tax=Phycicoccus avicenniae TaxID=2828860 RepID=A0A941I1J6_9MICO|nr:nuclease-related domain-containing protein [Phycicoccus avicenniae]MBR7744366.1 NERD domain-containing protein [Phycicoccus avicenniae]
MSTAPDVKLMRLRYAGACTCGVRVEQGERAGWDRGTKQVVCLRCLETPSADESESVAAHSMTPVPPALSVTAEADPAPPPPAPLDVGVAGAAARREYERRKTKDDAARAERSALWRALNGFFYPDGRQTTHAWKVGAAGETRVAAALLAASESGLGYALHDRRVPGKRSNIDHLFVGAAGVYVIDAKFYKNAEISVERSGGLFGPQVETLKVKGRKCDALVTAMGTQQEVVRAALAGTDAADAPVIPVLCFVDGLLPMRVRNRQVGGVRLCGLKGLGKLVAGEGDWDDARRLAVAHTVAARLPSIT